MMDAPAQGNLFTKRYSKVRRDPLEYKMQIALVDLLNKILHGRRVGFWHTPNGELRDIQTGAKLKAMGVRPGVADLQFMWAEPASFVGEPKLQKVTHNLFLELKRRGEDLSHEQEAFRDDVLAWGAYYEVADSIDGAIEILKKYGVVTNVSVGRR